MSSFATGDRLTRLVSRATTRLESQVVILDAERGEYQVLRGTAGRAWEVLERPMTVDELCTTLAAEYGVTTEQCRNDVLPFLSELERLGLLNVESA